MRRTLPVDRQRDIGDFWTERFPSGAIWLGVAVVFFKFLWYDSVIRLEEQESWMPVQAHVIDVRITQRWSGNDYDLSATFEAPVAGEMKRYSSILNSGKKSHMERMAEKYYPEGGDVTLLVNPHNPSEFSLGRERRLGPWLVGFIPGVLFTLISFSILLYGRSTEAIQREKAKKATR